GVDRGLDVASGGVDVAIEIELENDAGRAVGARGRHLCDARNVAEIALEGSGDVGSHGFRACTGKAGAYGDGRKINSGKRSDRQELESDRAGKKNGNGEESRRDGAANERRGEVGGKVHALISVCGLFDGIADMKGKTMSEPIESKIDDGRGVERKNLTQDEAADDGDAKGAAKFGADTSAECERKTAEKRGHGGHHDWAAAEAARFIE